MIKLKNEINKSATMRELRKEAKKGYEHSWQPELQVEAFMKGAEALLNLLHLPRVSNSVCEICGKPVHPSYNLCFEHLVCNVPKPKQTDC